MKLMNEQWAVLAPLFELPPREDRRGRPPLPAREVLDGILWILKAGARWQDLPEQYPTYQSCHRRFQAWVKDGTLRQVLERLATDLHERGGLDIRETFIDGTFSSARKGAFALAKPSVARAPRSWQLQTVMVYLSPYALKVLRRMK
ncbi:putative transposase of IS4/5 family DUF4096 [Permianibacter aggregans]|uniref:Putative transposase of IS4/5 family DUF4096 n=1 Tax=Permianibacter aggregans TaxID=1510150 RepID=A0A4R6V301_9GAMM|nr:putative transposase of IS4/5 family DUF4096 [Permianibacter aggregans]